MTYADWVSLGGRRVRLDDLRAHPSRYERLLAHTRAQKSANCLCRQSMPQLVIRCTQTGRHHLACWPRQGPEHDPRCAFFQLEPELSARRSYARAAINETDSGASLHLAVPLKSLTTDPKPKAAAPTSHAGVKQQTIGLLGTLHFLWEATRLIHWSPQVRRRDWHTITAALREQLDQCTFSGQQARDVLYLVPPYVRGANPDSIELFDTFMNTLHSGPNQIRRGLILGEIKLTEPSKHGVSYTLAQQGSSRKIFASAEFDTRMRHSFRNAFGQAATDAGGRRVALFCVEKSRTGYAVAIDAAVMLTNNAYVPADSSYEVRMADALAAAGRSFVKPLRYDTSEAVLPDFVLLDQPRTYVEVWGLPGRESYEQRKQRKVEHYQNHARELIEWNVNEPMPVLS
ncbi:Predicted transcriptional regulators containing the CopG/Arc/MetJ DNA-binding domain [Mycobacteroides abscessus subsp. abscessus]|uniref:DUF1173 family protein n=1 Tax=Mycobacteroides abscessus TaxID=36809 RepID=UPI0009D3D23B|nr:DUF1173 family protein [Mycobacteroides abscessus]SLI00684.1 Predicted transcriptional regulators containing the CopG/Arc/MetJ DNA-binding domain [Mycobacteroides abscessus subsp. abscessus]